MPKSGSRRTVRLAGRRCFPATGLAPIAVISGFRVFSAVAVRFGFSTVVAPAVARRPAVDFGFIRPARFAATVVGRVRYVAVALRIAELRTDQYPGTEYQRSDERRGDAAQHQSSHPVGPIQSPEQRTSLFRGSQIDRLIKVGGRRGRLWAFWHDDTLPP